MAAPAAAAASASVAVVHVPNPAEFKFYDADPSSSDDTDSDREEPVDARTFLFSAIGVAYTDWYDEAIPDTRNCQQCQDRGRVCLEYYDQTTKTWYCLWRVITLGMKAVKAAPVSVKTQKKRKTASADAAAIADRETKPGKRASAAAAAASADTAVPSPPPGSRTPEMVRDNALCLPPPAKKRKIGEITVPTASELATRKRFHETASVLSMMPSDVVGLVTALAGPVVVCASGYCDGSSPDQLCRDACKVCDWFVWVPSENAYVFGGGLWCRSCLRVHENTKNHLERVELADLNARMGKNYKSLEEAQAEYDARQLEWEATGRLRHAEILKQRQNQKRKERRAEKKVAAAAAAAAAELQAVQDALDESETAQPDPDADAPIA